MPPMLSLLLFYPDFPEAYVPMVSWAIITVMATWAVLAALVLLTRIPWARRHVVDPLIARTPGLRNRAKTPLYASEALHHPLTAVA